MPLGVHLYHWKEKMSVFLFFYIIFVSFFFSVGVMDESIFTDENELVKLLKIPQVFKKTRIEKLDIDFFDEMGKILLASYSLDAFTPLHM
jgi:hypothetical protein